MEWDVTSLEWTPGLPEQFEGLASVCLLGAAPGGGDLAGCPSGGLSPLTQDLARCCVCFAGKLSFHTHL